MVRTRVAVSPTGYPHIGTIYQSLFDYAYARRHKGHFIIRIEDTDRIRFVPDAEKKLYESLDWFGLSEDESSRKGGKYSPYVQSERLSLYQQFAKQLVEKNRAYYCFCSRGRLEEIRSLQQKEKKPLMYDRHCRKLPREESEKKLKKENEWVIRLKVPENKRIIVKDEVRGAIEFDSNLVDDQVLLKSDGFPTYHLAVVVDDHLMEISHVVRGEEWLSSAPKHFLLYEFFGWQRPLFYHTSALRNPDHSKLSKRQGHTSISWYQEEGYLPQAILNYIALLGWSHPKGKEIFSLDEFISLFDLKDIKPVGPIFDLKKLNWMNGEYIRSLSVEELSRKLRKNTLYETLSKDTFLKLVALAQSRMQTLKEFSELVKHFYEEPIIETTPQQKQQALAVQKKFQKLSKWEKEQILASLKEILKEFSIKMPQVYTLLTGNDKGLPLPESLVLLGKDKTIERLKNIAI